MSTMNKKKLPNVTLFGIDCVDIDRLIRAAEISQQGIEFGAVKLLTSLHTDHPHAITIDPVKSYREYSEFMLKKLDSFIDTEFVLVIQHDGYVLNPYVWTDEFLKYDYIGAPYIGPNGILVVGNGGFSLRSKKLTSFLASDNKILITNQYDRFYFHNSVKRNKAENEDQIISEYCRSYIESHGIRFAHVELAKLFSIESNSVVGDLYNNQFGFHGFGLRYRLEDHPLIKKMMSPAMIRNVKKNLRKIENKRGSKKIHEKLLVALKDIYWYFSSFFLFRRER